MDRHSARSGAVPLAFTLTFVAKMRRKQNGPAYQLFGRDYQAGRPHKTLNHPAPGMLKPAVPQPLRPKQTLISQMDPFTVIAIAIVVVLIITIVVMGGWLR